MLFVTFLLSGIILFLLIYAYSVVQLKKQNNEIPLVSDVSEPANKGSLFEKFKRKNAPKIEPETTGDSSISVGGVTAKVSASIKQVVAPIAEKVPGRKDRVAPRLAEETTGFAKSKQVVKEKEAMSFEPKLAPSQPKVTVESEAQVEAKSSNAALEQMAEEYAAQQSESDRISQDAIEQVYAEQKANTARAIPEASEGETHEKQIVEDAQQDLLEQVGLDTAQTRVEQSQATNQATNNANNIVTDKSVVDSEHNEQRESFQREQAVQPAKKEFRAEANAVEIVAKISGGEAVSRDDTLVVFRKYDYLFTRHLGVYGKNSLTELWEDVEQSGQEEQFSEIALSLQLADKTGAMTRKESNTFSTLAIEMSDKADKKLEFSMDIDESVEKGRMLDELARKYDAMVVCNIIPKRRKGFRSTDIKSCTKDLDMMPSKNGVFGRYAKISGVNSLRYSLALANGDGDYISSSTRDPFQVDEIVVFMNVPLVINPSEAFQTMINDARKLGAWMDGKIVDKNARNMTSRTLDKIADQIAMIEKEMDRDGLLPGSDICKKLF